MVSWPRLVANALDMAVRWLGIAQRPGSLSRYSRPALAAVESSYFSGFATE
jgi:hypothetical protein